MHCSTSCLLSSMTLRPPRSTLFPYTRSSDLHLELGDGVVGVAGLGEEPSQRDAHPRISGLHLHRPAQMEAGNRSEEHTSELQSPDHLVCRLLLEKKNNKTHIDIDYLCQHFRI